MLEPSPRLRKEASKIGCTPNHIIMADLMLSGYTEVEAYEIAYSEEAAFNAQKKIANRERELASDGYKRAYDARKTARKFVSEEVDDRDKGDIVKELNRLASLQTDPRVKAELLMKIADIQNMKKDMTDNDDPVLFYLPLDCDKCPFIQEYNKYIGRRNKELPKDEREAPLRADEMQMIIEAADKRVKRERAGN